MDYLGLMIAVAIGTFIAILLAAIDALLLKRQIDWLNNWAVRWFVFFDDMKIPHIPKIVALFLGKYAWLLLCLGFMLMILCATLTIYHVIADITMPYGSEVLWGMAVGAAAVVYFFAIKLLGYAAAKGKLLLMLIGIIALFVMLNYLMDPSSQEINSEQSLLAATFEYIILLVLFVPLGVYLAVLLALFTMLASFWVFRVTTCHLFELSTEKKTIFSHIGVLVGMLVAVGKAGLEFAKMF